MVRKKDTFLKAFEEKQKKNLIYKGKTNSNSCFSMLLIAPLMSNRNKWMD